MNLIHLDGHEFTVSFARDGVMLDLGAIGKGYALERAVELLQDAGVTSAMIHGGTSTVHAIGRPPGDEPWKIAIERPQQDAAQPAELLALVPLENEAMSVSAIWGRSFRSGEKSYGHVIDPRTGHPAEAALLSAVVLPSATETDALSTALLTMGSAGLRRVAGLRDRVRCLVVERRADQLFTDSIGIPHSTH